MEQLTPSRLQGVSPKTIRLAARILKAYREGGKIAAYRLLDFNELNKVTAKGEWKPGNSGARNRKVVVREVQVPAKIVEKIHADVTTLQ